MGLEGDVENIGIPITRACAQLVAQHIVHSTTLTIENTQAAGAVDYDYESTCN